MNFIVKVYWIVSCWCILLVAGGRPPGLPCPRICECFFTSGAFLNTDCSARELGALPEGIDTQTQILDLSRNTFDNIPTDLIYVTYLEKLNMSENVIKGLLSTILLNMTLLNTLDLSRNQITSWDDIAPSNLLKPAENLKTLVLSGNQLTKFSNLKNSENLVSNSLQKLELSSCGITAIQGRSPLSGLSDIRELILSFNPLKKIQRLISPTLENLDLSHCELSFIGTDDFNYLPALRRLILSHNYRLVISSNVGILNSYSVNYIDLSYCNMDKANMSGLPNLQEAKLRGNMIRCLNAGDFLNNTKLLHLDLSSNAIGSVHANSFEGLYDMKTLNLSVNLVPSLSSKMFKHTPKLTTLSLSRNYISHFGSLSSRSLEFLDLSMCEIQYLSSDIFDELDSILDINLSRNLISYLPNNMTSKSLQVLDLSFNRLSLIDNKTFFQMPSLTTIHLSENRFTNTWSVSYFLGNSKLVDISMRDNTWRCDCFEKSMKELYIYLTNDSPKIWSTDSLICHSPTNVSGKNWFEACYNVWYPQSGLGENRRALSFMLVIFSTFFGVCIVIMLVRRVNEAKLRAAQVERDRVAAESRDRLREERARREQEAQRNAPDPRDLVSPPSYDEALLMPRLDGSFHSLSGVGLSQTKQKKRARRRTRSSGDLLEELNGSEDQRRRRRRRSKVLYSSPPQDSDLTTVRFLNGSDGDINGRSARMHESDL